MSLQELIDRQLAIAAQADPHHCSQCGRDLDRWYYGFPLPLCARCMGARLWGTCPRCGAHVRQSPAGSGVLTSHGPNGTPCASPVSGTEAA
jgi:hypothetical protein